VLTDKVPGPRGLDLVSVRVLGTVTRVCWISTMAGNEVMICHLGNFVVSLTWNSRYCYTGDPDRVVGFEVDLLSR